MSIKLVTGANGFVAKALCAHLLAKGLIVRGSVRDESRRVIAGVEPYVTTSINAHTDWQNALRDVDVIFHLAATVHRPDIQDSSIYQASIADASLALARQAADHGVKRFVYLSTSHVYGVEAGIELISETHPKNPKTPYGVAKLAAEQALLQLAQQTSLEVVIVRPPLIYGPGVLNNFTQLFQLVKKLPILPFGCANNKRSFIGIENLIAFLDRCSIHSKARNEVFNISDDQDLSTKQLCQMIAHILQQRNLLLPVPKRLMRILLALIAKKSMYNKLFESVRLDVHHAKTILNWTPSFTMEQQLLLFFNLDLYR